MQEITGAIKSRLLTYVTNATRRLLNSVRQKSSPPIATGVFTSQPIVVRISTPEGILQSIFEANEISARWKMATALPAAAEIEPASFVRAIDKREMEAGATIAVHGK